MTTREQILERLGEYHREQGVAFLSHTDAVDYFRGLVELMEEFLPRDLSPVCTCVGVDFGTYERQVSMKIPEGEVVGIDVCISRRIGELWLDGITTIASCCGHGKLPATVIVAEEDVEKMEELGYPHEEGEANVLKQKTVFRL